MGFPTRCAVFAFALAFLWAADPEPRYDPATVVTVRMVVAEVREVPAGHPLSGIHLMARPESARADSEPWDVYLGPTQFLKEMDLTFQVRDRWDVVGSKIKQGNSVLILSKEIRRNGSTLYIREDNGEPMWKLKGA